MLEGLKWLFSLVVGRRKEKVPLIDLRAPPQVKRAKEERQVARIDGAFCDSH